MLEASRTTLAESFAIAFAFRHTPGLLAEIQRKYTTWYHKDKLSALCEEGVIDWDEFHHKCTMGEGLSVTQVYPQV